MFELDEISILLRSGQVVHFAASRMLKYRISWYSGIYHINPNKYPCSNTIPSLFQKQLYIYLQDPARYRLKYCLKGPLNPKQPTNLQDL